MTKERLERTICIVFGLANFMFTCAAPQLNAQAPPAVQPSGNSSKLQLAESLCRSKDRTEQSQGFDIYSKLAEAGDTSAMERLAGCYATGVGTTRDIKNAMNWFERAAE